MAGQANAGIFRVYCVTVPAGTSVDERDNLPIGSGAELAAEFRTAGEALQFQQAVNLRIDSGRWAVVTKNVTKGGQ